MPNIEFIALLVSFVLGFATIFYYMVSIQGKRFGDMNNRIGDLDKRIDGLDKRIDDLGSNMNARFSEIQCEYKYASRRPP